MKKYIFSVLAVLGILSSGCARDEMAPLPNTDDNSILATLTDIGTIQTRALMVDNPGVNVRVYWQAEDHIGIFGTGGSNVDFVLQGETLSEDGHTALFRTTSSVPTGDLLAYFPYMTGATGADGKPIVERRQDSSIARRRSGRWSIPTTTKRPCSKFEV